MTGLFTKPLGSGVHPFHITDLENLYAGLRDGNRGSTVQVAVRILDGAMNGPRASEETIRGAGSLAMGQGPYTFAFAEKDNQKAKEIRQKLEELVGEKDVEDDDDVKPTAEQKAAADKLAKETAHYEKLAETGTAAQKAEAAKWLAARQAQAEKDAAAADDKAKEKKKGPPARFESPAIAAGGIPWDFVLGLVTMIIEYLKSRGL